MVVLLLLACGHDDDATVPAPGPFLGADPAVPAKVGEARAGVVRDGPDGEAALFGGITAEGAAGDLKLYNDRIQVVIQGAYRSHGVVDVGGAILDLDLVRSDGTLGRDTVEDLCFLGFGLSRLFEADRVEVVADGSDGGDAVVRATGHDVGWDYIQGLLEFPSPTLPDLGLDIVQTYRLAPDSWTVQITTELTNQGAEAVTFTLQDGVFASGEDTRSWTPGVGLSGASAGDVAAMAFTGRSGEATFSLWRPDGPYAISGIAALASDLGVQLADHPPIELAPGETATVVRNLTVGGDTAAVEAERRAAAGEALGEISGRVLDASGGVAGARVHLVDGQDAVAGFATTDADGAWSARLPPGDWTAWVVAHDEPERVELPAGAGRYGPFAAASVNAAQLDALSGQTAPPPLPFATGRRTGPGTAFQVSADAETSLDLTIDEPSALVVEVSDDGGAPLPGVVEVRWVDDAPPPSEVPEALWSALGIPSGSRAAWAWTATGTVEIPVLPGTYDVLVGHSWRHGRAVVPRVTVGVGQTATVPVDLEEVVPRDGWLSLDSHLHAAPSFDGALPMEDRLVTCAATGLDLPVSTDHDAIGDYRPIAEALGLQSLLAVIPGVEVTTILRGHFNLYPIEPAPLTEPNGGAEPWWHTPVDTQELFDRMRQTAGPDALVQVNHPRSPGMFVLAGYDPETAEPDKADHFSWDFDVFELLNGGDDHVQAVRDDWFSFLDTGRIRVPLGASDSHYRYIPCGLAHTDVYLGVDGPADTSPAEVRDALLAGHVVVAAGTTLRAELVTGGVSALPGDTVVGSSGTLSIQVRTPDWMQPGTLRIYRNGVVVHEQVLDTRGPDGTWLDGAFDVDSTVDAWFVVEVEGDLGMGDAWRGTPPHALTNAFFLDVDGDGWTPPG